MVTCYLRYQIDPRQTREFEHYARLWIPLVERFGGQLRLPDALLQRSKSPTKPREGAGYGLRLAKASEEVDFEVDGCVVDALSCRIFYKEDCGGLRRAETPAGSPARRPPPGACAAGEG